MSNVITVVNTTQYQAIQLVDDESAKIVAEWAKPYIPEGEKADFTPFINEQVWAIKHPTGQMTFVSVEDYQREFVRAAERI